MSDFTITPAGIRLLAGRWSREGSELTGLRFGAGSGAAHGCETAAALSACARDADAAVTELGESIRRLGRAVHRFSDLAVSADTEAAARIIRRTGS
ncbi:MAG: hypothetical protein QM809_00285 [Gordonia sp. (in: high G+C Gram-positive bacteria)]|uniref:hypothetical protein n=1 Tax=Gordonia sp. (in: high G+C Gram-positive bacteria) TaxID=84139 RepID=UPI0039E48F60